MINSMKKMTKSISENGKKGAMSAFLGLGLAMTYDSGIYLVSQAIEMAGPLSEMGLLLGSSVLVSQGLLSMRKNSWEATHVYGGGRMKRMINLIKGEKLNLKYKPSIVGNAFLAVGATALWGYLHMNPFDFREVGLPIGRTLMNNMTPNVLFLSTIMAAGIGMMKGIFEKLNKSPDVVPVDTDKKVEPNYLMKKIDDFDSKTFLDGIDKVKQGFLQKEESCPIKSEEKVKFKPLK